MTPNDTTSTRPRSRRFVAESSSRHLAMCAALALVFAACGGDGSRREGSASEATGEEGSTTGGADGLCTQSNPQYACTAESCAGDIDCGAFESSYDEQGCYRAECVSDADCPEGQGCYDPIHCRPTWLACTMVDGEPDLSFSGDCQGKYCLDTSLLDPAPDWPTTGDVISVCPEGLPRDPVEIVDTELTWGGDEYLWTVTVGYAGPCVPHSFAPCWTGAFEGMGPYETRLWVAHDANADTCSQSRTDVRLFDAAPLITAFHAAHPEPNAQLNLMLDGWATPLVYDP